MRKEKDTMGYVEVPDDAYYGAQTKRAFDNFQISNSKIPFELIYSIAIIKRSAAIVNFNLGKLDLKIKNAWKIISNTKSPYIINKNVKAWLCLAKVIKTK